MALMIASYVHCKRFDRVEINISHNFLLQVKNITINPFFKLHFYATINFINEMLKLMLLVIMHGLVFA